LPHLDALDLELTTLLPSWVPGVPGIPELERSVGGSVDPRLASDVVLEPTIGTTNSDVEDEVEVLVERSRVGTAGPWVLERSTVAGGRWEVTFGPEWLVEVDVHDLEKAGVDV